MIFETDGMREGYAALCGRVLREGSAAFSRGRPTMEAQGALVVLHDPLDALPVGTGRGVVTSLAAVEALSLIAGEADPVLFVAAAPHYAQFVDPVSGELDVAYGPRLGDQMAWAAMRLRADPGSRQAHVDLWRDLQDGPGLRAYPCVTSCGFTIRNARLSGFVEMRSNDLWLGFPYDAFAFGQLQATLGNVLRVPLGSYHHYARSLHLYADGRDLELAEGLTAAPSSTYALPFAGVSGDDWREAAERAHYILRGVALSDMTPSERAYLDVMVDRVLPKTRSR